MNLSISSISKSTSYKSHGINILRRRAMAWQPVTNFLSSFSSTKKIKVPLNAHQRQWPPTGGLHRLLPNKTNPRQLYSQNIPASPVAIPSNCLSSFFRYNQRKWIWIESHCGRRYYEAAERSPKDQYIAELKQVRETREEKKMMERRRGRKNGRIRGIGKQRNSASKREKQEERREDGQNSLLV